MAASRLVLLQLFVVLVLCANHCGLAQPTVGSGVTGEQQGVPITSEQKVGLVTLDQQEMIGTTTKTTTLSTNNKLRSNTNEKFATEKLKRGLTNFMNHLNPAPFFVPQEAATASAKSFINDGGADAVVKQPSRLTRPLRWGR